MTTERGVDHVRFCIDGAKPCAGIVDSDVHYLWARGSSRDDVIRLFGRKGKTSRTSTLRAGAGDGRVEPYGVGGHVSGSEGHTAILGPRADTFDASPGRDVASVWWIVAFGGDDTISMGDGSYTTVMDGPSRKHFNLGHTNYADIYPTIHVLALRDRELTGRTPV